MLAILIGIVCLIPVITCGPAQARESRAIVGGHCDQICGDEENVQKVCGSDGVTYDSQCHFQNAACKVAKTGGYLSIARRDGPCITMNSHCSLTKELGFHCSYYTKPVCGSDGSTYMNECYLFLSYCKTKDDPNIGEPLSLVSRGTCDLSSNGSRTVDCGQFVKHQGSLIAVEGGATVRLEIGPCPSIYAPLCGLQGGSYSNECSYCRHLTLHNQLSLTNLTVTIAHDGVCHNGPVVG